MIRREARHRRDLSSRSREIMWRSRPLLPFPFNFHRFREPFPSKTAMKHLKTAVEQHLLIAKLPVGRRPR